MSVAMFFLHDYLETTWTTGKNNLKRSVGEKKLAFEKPAQLVAILLFDCFWAAEVLLFCLFSVEEIGADCRLSNQPEMT